MEGKRTWLADDHNQVRGDATAGGGHDSPSLEINTVDGILTIKVQQLDTIYLLSPDQGNQHTSDPYTQIVQWRTELDTLLLAGQNRPIEEVQEMICGVMLCKQDLPDLELLRRLIWTSDAAEFEEVVDYKRWSRELVMFCRPRRRCITSEGGFLGQVPLHAQVGDMIVIPIGSAVPFVVRPCQARYQLVGQAYIHGVMMGEAFQVQHLDETLEDIQLI